MAKKKTAKKNTKKAAAKPAKKTVVKATAKTKTTTKGPVSTKAITKVSKARTKGQIVGAIADATGVAKRDINMVFEKLGEMIGMDLNGPGKFTLPGLMKVVVIRKPATKARKGTNPFTGEEMMFKAKPARNVVKIRPLKALKDKV